MKKLAKYIGLGLLGLALLAFGGSKPSHVTLAEGGAPPPECPPSICPGR
jgi:hypothetical protein